jgi:uncharacterized protein involved in exopolysaccharide biosynthesis
VNRRLLTFIVVFAVATAAGLIYTFSIPPTYVATATLQIDPPTTADQPQERAAFVATQTQVLASNEILEAVVARLRDKQSILSGADTVPRLREMLAASHVAGTNTINLQARGPEREQLAELVNAWAAIYLESRDTRGTSERDADEGEARRAVDSIEARVSRKRQDLDAFRRQHSIVSPEREENEVAAQMRSLTTALNDARNKATEAESRLSAIQSSIANGSPVYRPQDKALITQHEQRIGDLRQKLAELELRFTPDYLAVEPAVKAMRTNIRQLEQEIERTRRSSQQAMIDEASQDVALTRKNVARLESQFGERRSDALRFTSQFAEHKARVDELTQLERQLAQAKERLAGLERKERGREPRYELLGAAVVPGAPAHPDYVRYAGYSVGGGLLVALLAVFLVEYLSPRAKPEALAYPQPIIQIAYPALENGAPGAAVRVGGAGQPALPGAWNRLPATPASLDARELTLPEVKAVWNAATKDGRLAIAALFSGLTLEELADLSWGDVDLESACVRLARGRGERVLISPLADELRERTALARVDARVAGTTAGTPLSLDDLAGLVAAAVHDAGLPQPETINADVLRNTYICYLVRQGLKLVDLETLVGAVPPGLYLQYRSISPAAPSGGPGTVERVYPAFQRG